jgi:hypothetical protein
MASNAAAKDLWEGLYGEHPYEVLPKEFLDWFEKQGKAWETSSASTQPTTQQTQPRNQVPLPAKTVTPPKPVRISEGAQPSLPSR